MAPIDRPRMEMGKQITERISLTTCEKRGSRDASLSSSFSCEAITAGKHTSVVSWQSRW